VVTTSSNIQMTALIDYLQRDILRGR
jgi:hypothetical protein